MFRWKKGYFCRSVVKVLVFLMVMHGLPLWELGQSYEWVPRNYVTNALNQIVSILNHGAVEAAYPPVADAGNDRSQMKNQPLGSDIVLDGTASNEPDSDPLTYQWYGPFATTSGPTPSVDIPEGTYTVSLIVDDGTIRSEVDTAAITITPCSNISARAKSGKVQLTWTHQDGTERYDVYRADEADPFSFEKIGETTSTYSTYLDEPVANETTYLYVVGALSQGEWCYSNVISSHPTALRTRANYAPIIYSSPITHGTTEIIYNYDVNAADPNGDALSYNLFDHPAGMGINPDTGLIAWTPNEAGSYDVTAEVSDSSGGTDTQSFTIVVGPIIVPNQPPVANAGGPYEGQVNSPISFDGSQSYDPDEDELTLKWDFGDSSPQGNGMHVTHVYDQEGTYQATLTVEDGRGGVDTATAQVTVTPPPEMDLQPITMDVSAVLVDPQTLEMTGTVEIEIRNNGTTYVADSYELAFYEDTNMNQILDADADQLLGSSTVAHGPAGETSITVSVDITGTTLFAGNLIYVFVDRRNQIEETNEDNNITHSMADCEYVPPVGSFDPVLEWEWTGSTINSSSNQVMCTPVVANLTDDNGDGIINQRDVPDIIFNTFAGNQYNLNGTLRAISGDGSGELFAVTDYRTLPGCNPAVGDIDNDGLVEIIVVEQFSSLHRTARILAFENDGTFKWASEYFTLVPFYNTSSITLSDIDVDGNPEVIMGNIVLKNDGTTKWVGSEGNGRNNSIVADLDLDGYPELVAGNTAYKSNGDILWHNESLGVGFPAVANFDDDPNPEIVFVTGGYVYLLEHSGDIIWGPIDLPPGGTSRDHGGPPTIADFDSDGEPEIGIAGGYRYVVFESDGSVKWTSTTRDYSSSITGSSVFDFEGDGSAEVVYSDEQYLRIYRGTDGVILFQTYIGSGTLLELPLIVDVDNDNNAEIVIASNSYAFGGKTGIQVFGDANDTWVNTRKIWNQHAYNITNVNDDGTIPRIAANNWEIFNNFRQNQMLKPFGCIDLTASYIRVDTSNCPDAVEIIARIGNGGALHTAPGIKVAFYDGDPDNGGVFLGTTDLNNRLDPGEYADIGFAPQNALLGIHTIYVVVDDDGMGHGMVSEIDEVNNKAWTTFDLCNNPPIITSSPITTGIEGIQYTYDVDATDPDSDTLVYTLALFSENMTIDESTGLIQWVPLSTHIGSHSIIVSVSDGRGGIATQSFTITVEGTPNNPPVITSAPVTAATEGSTYTYNVEASDADNDVLTFSLITAPATMTIDPGSGLVQWTPSFTDAGSHAVEVKVVDGRGGEDTQAFVIDVEDVNFPPRITSSPVTTATEGVLYEYDVIAIDDDGNALTFSLLTAPAGMTIDSGTGLIEWTPTSAQVGDNNISVRVEDTGGLFDTQGFTITVEGANHPPVIISDPITVFSLAEGTQSNFRPGELFISSSLTDEIRVYDAETLEFIQAFTHPLFDVPGSPSYSFGPNGLAFNNRGNLVVAAYSHFVEFSDYGAEYARYPKSVSEANETLIFDPLGNLYTTTSTGGSNLLNQYCALDYSFQQSITLPPGAGQLTGITFDDQRRIYVGSQADAKIHVFSADETFSTFTYVNSFDAPASGWMGVEGLQINQNGELVVACTDMFRYNTNTGEVLGSFDAPFDSLPVPVTIDNLGRIYVADFENGSGTVGADIIRFSSDGSSFIHVNDANLFGPFGLVISGTSLPGGPSPRYVYDVDATDPDDGDVLTFSLDVAPAGMEIDPITGLIVWTSKDMQVGDHSVTVRVEDGAGLFDNQSFTVTVADVNERPVANAGSDRTVFAGDTVTFDGSGSSDGDSDPLTYQWSFTSIPSGSGAALSNPAIIDPTFVADLAGAYVVQLVVNDGMVNSEPDTVTITANEVMVMVPDVVGMAQTAAEAAIIAANLSVGNITTQNSATVPAGNVISQNPVAGASVTEGSAVDLVVSLGPVVVNRDPEITSTPLTSAGIDILYSYDVEAIDLDGDTLTYSLIIGPSGMAINAGTGLVSWTTDAGNMGTHSIDIQVSDGRGGTDTQSYTILVSATANHPPEITSSPVTGAAAGVAYQYNVEAADQDGYPLTFSLTEASAGMTINIGTGLIEWTPDAAQIGPQDVTVRVEDTPGAFDTQSFTVTVVLPGDIVPPEVTVTVNPAQVNPDEPVTITVDATDDVGVVSVELFVNGTLLSLDASNQAIFSSSTPGIFTATATARDAQGNAGTGSEHFRVLAPGDNTSPTVSITSPPTDSEITAPTQIIGTASDENLVGYRLELSPKDQNQWTVFAEGNISVTNDVLGTFDSTQLLNGLYDVRLTAEDANGQESSTSVVYRVAEDLKVGNFSITLQDLAIPMAGIPITINRTYDSRDKGSHDFGHGWSIDIQNVKVTENRVLGTSWNQTKSGWLLPTYCLEPIGKHYVSITLPDGRTEEFDMTVNPQCKSPMLVKVRAVFDRRPGTFSSLSPIVDGPLIVPATVVGPVDLTVEFDPSFAPYDPDEYQLTTPEGMVYVINQYTGIKTVTDPNGNTLTYGSDGIIHSAGKSIVFTRDAQGRITRITDPNGGVITYEYDFRGDLISTTDQEGDTTRYGYNSSHGLIELTDPRGITPARNIYDDEGRLIAHIDAYGNRIEYTHNIDARQEVVRDRLGNISVYEYDDDGNVLTETDPLGNTTSYTYDENGNKESKTDPLGNTTNYTCDARGNEESRADPEGNTISWTYNKRNQLLTTTDPLGHISSATYDANGNLLSKIDPMGNTTTKNYDSSGNLTSSTDCFGTTTYKYDTFGNKISEIDSLDNETTFTYDANGNALSKTTTRTTDAGPVTMTTRKHYDNLNRLVRTIDPYNNETITEYNAIGKKSATVDKNGNRTTYEYGLTGNLTKTTYPDGSTETAGYDANGNKLTSTDRAGRTTRYEYDAGNYGDIEHPAGNRLTRMISPDGSGTGMEYDAAGRLIATINENGSRLSYEYDAAGRRTWVTDALGNVTTFTYDANGNEESITDANGNTITYEYDALNRKIKTIFSDGTFTAVEYAGCGTKRKTSETDQAGNTTRFEYDALGHLTKVIDALGGETTCTYDEAGNKLTQTDPNGNTTRWAYDNLGRIVKHTLPMGMFETFAYDPHGNAIGKTDFNGNTITYKYDVTNRLIKKSYPDGSEVSFTYTATGRRERVTDTRGVTSYRYDLRDRLVEVINPDGTVIAYTYDPKGNRTSVAVPSGNTTYTYDTLNRLETVTDPDGGVTGYTYDSAGNRASVTCPNGTVAEYTYDALNRLTYLENRKSTAEIISSYTYTLGHAGNRIKVEENAGRVVNYKYDNLYRLTQEQITDPVLGDETISYTYDAFGNRLTKTDSTGATNYTYNANDQLVTETAPAYTNTYTYDGNGNTTRKSDGITVTDYDYSYDNRLIAAQTGASQTSYAYDADGIRVEATSDGVITHYLVDKNRPYAQVLEETDGSGSLVVSYIYGDDLISQDRGGSSSYYHYDGQMSTRKLTNASGTITDSYVYDAFGILIDKTGTTVNNFLYTGEQYDPNVGFYYLRARYYNPESGRFMTHDPRWGSPFEPMSLHKYLYANANPINFMDPSGEIVLAIGIIMIAWSLALTLVVGTIQATSIARGNTPVSWSGPMGVFTISVPHVGFGQIIASLESKCNDDGFMGKGKYWVLMAGLSLGYPIGFTAGEMTLETPGNFGPDPWKLVGFSSWWAMTVVPPPFWDYGLALTFRVIMGMGGGTGIDLAKGCALSFDAMVGFSIPIMGTLSKDPC